MKLFIPKVHNVISYKKDEKLQMVFLKSLVDSNSIYVYDQNILTTMLNKVIPNVSFKFLANAISQEKDKNQQNLDE
jgi:hypothetical protein